MYSLAYLLRQQRIQKKKCLKINFANTHTLHVNLFMVIE